MSKNCTSFYLQKAEKRCKRPTCQRNPNGTSKEVKRSPGRQVRYAAFEGETSISADERATILGVSPSHALVCIQGTPPTLLSVPLGWFFKEE